MKLGKLSKVFKSLMYKDKLDVYRSELKENDSYTYENVENVIPLYKDIPCKISNNFKDLPEEQSYLVIPTNQHMSIFCEPQYDIRKGDRLVIYRMNDQKEVVETFSSYAGKPNKEITHQEISLVDRNYA